MSDLNEPMKEQWKHLTKYKQKYLLNVVSIDSI